MEQVYANLTNAGGKSKVYIMLGQEDNYVVCTCDRCRAIMDEYGGQGMGGFSAIQIELANLVAEQVDKKLAQDGDTRKIQYGTFAYQTSRTAPAVWDESTQKYVPSSSRFTMRDNVFVLYAPIEMDFSQPLSSEVNKGIYEDLIKWRDILAYDNENNHAGETGVNTADNMMIWSYCIPKNMFTPLPEFRQLSQLLRGLCRMRRQLHLRSVLLKDGAARIQCSQDLHAVESDVHGRLRL